MAGLLQRQIRQLEAAGFTDGEIMMLNRDLGKRPATLNLDATPWRETLAKRKAYVRYQVGRLMNRGLTKRDALERVAAKINALYKQNEKLSPWVIMRREYKPPLHKAKDYIEAARQRAIQEVRKAEKMVARRGRA